MFEDFLAWQKQNKDLIEELQKHQSILYARIHDVERVLIFISKLDSKYFDDDMSIIFETGYAYLYSFMNDIKLYLENYFHNNFKKLIKNEVLINFSLYVCEIKDSLIDDNVFNEIIGEQFEYILNDIEERLANDSGFDDNVIEDYNNRLLSVMPMDKTYKCVDEVFVDIYDALKMD